jgi:polyphosphate kinase 2 (PPK2 family)
MNHTPFHSNNKALAKRWAEWQPRPANGSGTKPVSLRDYDPDAKPFLEGDKMQGKEAVQALATELDALQNLLYADRRYKLLVLLQGTDASGKDGTVRGVFGSMSALGVHAVSWKAPPNPARARLPLAHPPADAGRGRADGVQPQPL